MKKIAILTGATGGLDKDLGVTNLGRIDIARTHGIEDILFVPPKVSYAKQVVGVSTYGSKLTISYHNMKSRPPAEPVACTGPIRAYYQPHLKGASNIFLLHEMLRRY